MPEKVLFEYRADEGEGGPQVRVRIDAGMFEGEQESSGAEHRATGRTRGRAPWARILAKAWLGKRGARRVWKKARRGVGDTLDFFEDVYRDLYGAEDERPTEEA